MEGMAQAVMVSKVVDVPRVIAPGHLSPLLQASPVYNVSFPRRKLEYIRKSLDKASTVNVRSGAAEGVASGRGMASFCKERTEG